MNIGSLLNPALLALAVLSCPLRAQTVDKDAAPAENAQAVAAALTRQIQGKPRTQDQPLTLEECLARALTTNPRIQEQKALIEAAGGNRLIFRSRAFPNLGLGFLGGQRGPRGDAASAQTFAIVTGTFNQPLFEAGIPASFRRGDVGVIVAQQTFQQQAVQILHQARIHYYTALLQQGTAAVLAEIQKPLDDNIKMEKDRLSTGLGTRSYVLQAQIRSLQLVPATEAAKAGYLENISLLAQDMGSNLADPAAVQLWLDGALPYAPVTFDLAKATEEALKNRPDLQLLRSLIRQTEEDRRIVRAGYYPRLDLIANGQYLPESVASDSNTARSGDENRTSQLLVGPAYTWAVIDTGRVTGQSLSLEKTREIYQIQLADLERNVPKNLSDIYRALDLAQNRISALAKSVKLAQDNLVTVQDLISLGQANQLDFVNARNALLQSKLGMLAAFYENSVALANLDLATGRYLRYVDPEPRKN